MAEADHSSSSRIWVLAVVLVVVVVVVVVMRDGNGDPAAADSDQLQSFRDVAAESGIDFVMGFLNGEQGDTFKINLYDHGCGVAVGDYDGDGHEDIYFLNQLGPNALFRNKGDATFEEKTTEAHVALEDRICTGATFADYDNDGDQDLFVTSSRGGNVLFRNQGGGQFEDATVETGVAHVGHSQTAVFFDYDNDGYLDLYVLNTAEWTTDEFDEESQYFPGKGAVGGLTAVVKADKEYNLLYHNEQDGTFTDVSNTAGLKGRGWASDAAVIDYDRDGLMDVYVASMFCPDQLYRNQGNGTFSDVTKDVLGKTSFGAIGAKVFDYDGDGLLDLLVVDMHSDMWMGLDYNHASLTTAQESEHKKFAYFNGPNTEFEPELIAMEQDLEGILDFRHDEVLFGNVLYRNLGDGTFDETTDAANLETFWPWGIAVGDFDNDSDEDVFTACGMGYRIYNWPNYLLINQGDGTFVDAAEEKGIEPPAEGIYLEEKIQDRFAARSSRCAATADFDGDGRLEIVTNNFNHRPYFFRNSLPQRNYIAFRLQGTNSNRDAIGALVTLRTTDGTMVRMIQSGSGYLSQSTRIAHFGLAGRKGVEEVEIVWPSGRVQVISAPEINKLHEVVEPSEPDAGP